MNSSIEEKKTPAKTYLTSVEIFQKYLVGLSYTDAKIVVSFVESHIKDNLNKVIILDHL